MGSPVPRSTVFGFGVKVRPARKTAVDGSLSGWSEAHRLPRIALGDAEPFAAFWTAWQPEGLWLAVRVGKGRAPRVIPNRLTEGDCVEFLVDTRDVRSAHRAGRFCHRFVVAPAGGAGRGRSPLFRHLDIPRATAGPAEVQPDDVKIGATVDEDRYVVELFVPGRSFTGFDVEVNRRFGLACVVHDTERGVLNWPHPTVLPVGIDPSLWAVAELVDEMEQ